MKTILHNLHHRYRLPKRGVVLLHILYFRPDFQSLLNSYTWQTEDEIPDLPRIHKFLTYWQHNIEAVIKDVSVSTTGDTIARWRHGNLITH